MHPKHYHEPWRAARRMTDLSDPFPEGAPPTADQDSVDRQREAAKRVSEQAGWIVWGSGMAEPGKALSLAGEPSYFNSEGVVVMVNHPATPDGSLRAKDIAERIALCVTACKDMRTPESVIPEVRDLLRDLCIGTADPTDKRIPSLLSRMLPAQGA